MKINEIASKQVDEGFWDALKAGASGVKAAATGKNPVQAASQTYQQSVGEKNLAGMAKTVMARWNQQMAPTIPPAKKTDPKTIKLYLDKFLSKYFAGNYSSNNKLVAVDAKSIGDYIRKTVNDEAAGMNHVPRTRKAKAKPAAPTAPTPVTPAAPTSALDPAVSADIADGLKRMGYTASEIKAWLPSIPAGTSVSDGIQMVLKNKQPAASPIQPPAPTAAPAVPTAPPPTPTPAPAAPKRQSLAKRIAAKRGAASENYYSSNPMLAESVLMEGGNVFPDVTAIKKEYVPGIIKKIQAIMPGGIQIIPPIGSAGFKVESGDMDVFVDAAEIAQHFNAADDKIAKVALKKYFEAKGYQAALTGRNVHIRMPVPGGTFVQVDVMVIPDAARVAPFHQHGPSGQYNDPTFKGGQLFIMYSSLAKAAGMKFSPFEGKLVDRTTGELVADNKDDVAKILLNPTATAANLASVKAIMAALANDPRKEEKIAQAREDAKKGLIVLPESVQPGTAQWFRDIQNILVS
jgi:hypothetical protein